MMFVTKKLFSFPPLKQVVGTQKNRLNETGFLLNTKTHVDIDG